MDSEESDRRELVKRKTYVRPMLRGCGRLDAVTAVASGSGKKGGGGPKPSDRRLKRDLLLIGRTACGLAIYRFRYLWNDVEMVGVMAQEVLAVRPDAVTVGDDGFYRVDYDALGTDCTTYEAWLATQVLARAA